MPIKTLKSFALPTLLAAMALPAFATAVLTPPALSAGSQYRIAFVTSTTGFATSTNIADYNTAVDTAANAVGSLLQPLGATWKAIGSTETVNAIDNIGGSSIVPIYLLDGTLLASGTADLFDGTLNADLSLTELGGVLTGVHVWTGSGSDGTTDIFGHFLGNAFNTVEFGFSSTTNSAWLHFNNENSALFPEPYYGISSVLTVGAAAPEPSTIGLVIAGLLVPAGIRIRRRFRGSSC